MKEGRQKFCLDKDPTSYLKNDDDDNNNNDNNYESRVWEVVGEKQGQRRLRSRRGVGTTLAWFWGKTAWAVLVWRGDWRDLTSR